MILRVASFHLALTLVVCLFAGYLYGTPTALSVTWGSALMGSNLILLLWAWKRIFVKKLIALAVSVIVFKYAILIAMLYLTITKQWAEPKAFVFGLGSLLPTVVWIRFQKIDKEFFR